MRRRLAFIPAVGALLALCLLHLLLGAAKVTPGDIWAAVTAFDSTNYTHVIIIGQRLTRLVVAIYAGAALAVAGLLLQKIMQNILVSPSTLGINAGATSFVICAVFFWRLSGPGLFLPALLGGIVAMGLTFLTSRLLEGQGDRKLNLILAGSMVSILFSSLTTFIVSLDSDAFGNLMAWLVGDIGNFDYLALQQLGIIGVIAIGVALLMSRAVDILVLGDEQAAVVGVDVRLIYGATLATAIVLAVSAVTVVGPIGFIGLVVPHAVKILFGETGRVTLWMCLIGGPIALISADILARTLLAPRLLNVGTVMGLSGGLVFLGLVVFGMRRGAR